MKLTNWQSRSSAPFQYYALLRFFVYFILFLSFIYCFHFFMFPTSYATAQNSSYNNFGTLIFFYFFYKNVYFWSWGWTFFFLRFEAENVLKMFLNLHDIQYLINQCRCDQETYQLPWYYFVSLDGISGVDLSYFGTVISKNCWLLQTERCASWSKKTTVNVIQKVPLSISVSFLFLLSLFYSCHLIYRWAK